MAKTAAILLNRNLPEEADALYNNLLASNQQILDIYVVESGSDPDRLSSYCSFYADWPSAIKHGLRYPQGMNYGLKKVRDLFPSRYDSYLLLANDTSFVSTNPINLLRETLFSTPRCGLVSPCGIDWGERKLMNPGEPKAFWYIHNNCYLVSELLVNKIANDSADHMQYFFDSTNFRGYGTESELLAKAYLNDYQCLITPDVISSERVEFLRERYSIVKTESESENFKLYIQEGLNWMRNKYGFSSRWDMNNYALNAYRQFFGWYPDLKETFAII